MISLGPMLKFTAEPRTASTTTPTASIWYLSIACHLIAHARPSILLSAFDRANDPATLHLGDNTLSACETRWPYLRLSQAALGCPDGAGG
ncbi:unnamed protein product [Boreogadus saida]